MELTASFSDLLQHFSPRLHRPHLPDLRRDRRRLGPLAAAPLHHRSHLLRRLCRQRTLVAVPSLLQPCRLGHRHLLHGTGQAGDDDPRAGRHPHWAVDDTLCRKRGLTLYGAGMHYDPLISSRAKAWSVGDTTGSSCVCSSSAPSGHRPRSSPCRSPPGCTATAKGSPRGRRAKGNRRPRSAKASRSQSSHPTGIGPGTDPVGGPVVPRP